ncbi:hypothetical protein NKG05_06885 [Oerskovia sp. M15]
MQDGAGRRREPPHRSRAAHPAARSDVARLTGAAGVTARLRRRDERSRDRAARGRPGAHGWSP